MREFFLTLVFNNILQFWIKRKNEARLKQTFIILFFISSIIFAQEKSEVELTGRLNQDFQISYNHTKNFIEDSINVKLDKRSPLLAGGLSLLLPGAGQYYNEDYWKTAIFILIEAAAITTAIVANNKGDEQTESFENFANGNWGVDQYAAWTVDNAARINPGIDPDLLNIYDSQGNVIWERLNQLESGIGSWYSHQLAPYGDQQYYEMIGKYQQFNPGWNDFTEDPNDPYTYGDPLAPNFLYYADERGEANSYYNTAHTAVVVLLVNHAISAIEAALAANSYNRSLDVNVSLQSQNFGYYREYYPQLDLRYRL